MSIALSAVLSIILLVVLVIYIRHRRALRGKGRLLKSTSNLATDDYSDEYSEKNSAVRLEDVVDERGEARRDSVFSMATSFSESFTTNSASSRSSTSSFTSSARSGANYPVSLASRIRSAASGYAGSLTSVDPNAAPAQHQPLTAEVDPFTDLYRTLTSTSQLQAFPTRVLVAPRNNIQNPARRLSASTTITLSSTRPGSISSSIAPSSTGAVYEGGDGSVHDFS